MKLYAVIDTNVLVSALLRWDSVPGRLLEQALTGSIIPLLCDEIMAEYENVLRRKKFSFKEQDIQVVTEGLRTRGIFLDPEKVEEIFSDPKDIIFYAVTMEAKKKHDAYLVTGNIKHFPVKPFVVTPREMLTILETGLWLIQEEDSGDK
ncbi:MAG: putative toxin-antitoxin system toxin component, PIN family [Desulfovibrio sp.]|nr:putative toxin-antitoxin system toxin component, PIN family [Desulfovibrio sp.]